MAIYLESLEARYLVGLYLEARKSNRYPAPGSWGEQTAYCVALFEFLDHVRAESEHKNAKASVPPAKS